MFLSANIIILVKRYIQELCKKLVEFWFDLVWFLVTVLLMAFPQDHELHCGFASEKCSQCQGIFQKNQLQEHTKLECPRRQIACPNCAMCMPYEEKKVYCKTELFLYLY